jgi:hypothetical protein
MDDQEIYEEAYAMADAALNRQYRKSKTIEKAELDRVIDMVGDGLSNILKEQLRTEMEQRFNIFVPNSETLIDYSDHEEWLLNARSTIDPKFWSRYREYLQREKGLPEPVLASTDLLTEDILGYLENPRRTGSWDRRGMVVGQVQSGKTANYTGLICKAADAGYKLIIVLAGIHNSLRSQTQLRLDEGFLGRDTNQFRLATLAKDSPKIGVGNLPGDCPAAIPLTTSHEGGDFKKRTAEAMSLPFGEIPLIIVAKKNTGILKNLLAWIQNNVAEKQGDKKVVPGKVPLLLLDDEADNASINTRKLQRKADGSFEEDQDVTKTNSLIRQILNTFERRAYVGYTATPFANIFIHPNATTRREGEDLFPKSFIVNLRPPSNYIGPVQVFGLDVMDSDGSEGMPIVRSADDTDFLFPVGHKMDLADELERLTVEQLPSSLHESVRAFVLVCAARRVRGQVSVHNSMLIHVTRYIRVQSAVTGLIQGMVADLKRRIRYGDGAQKPTLLEELRELWERDFEPTSTAIRTDFFPTDGTLTVLTWDQIEPELLHAIEKIKVKEINGNAADALEYYENQEHGLSVIAIGGDKLSRGLTLEGLSISYYLRTTYMYDTLMQMGRWFGYRPGYADLCRLYTSSELQQWYQHITMASEELRSEFDAMAKLRLTPKDFGLKVQTHPGQLLVTSANKARFGQKIRMSYMGQLIESYALPKDKDSIDANLKAAQELIVKLDATITPEARGEAERTGLPSALVWRGVRPQVVMDFLNAFKGAPDTRGNAPSHASVPARQAEFIGKKVRQRAELTEWVVVLCSSTTGVKSGAVGREIGLIQRTPADGSKPEDGIYYIRKNHIIDPRHESLDLTDEEQVEALAEEKSLKPDATYPRGGISRRIRPRQRGLLLLYALDPTIEKPVKKNRVLTGEKMRLFPVGDPRCDPAKPVIGFAISFPGFGTRDNPDDAIEYLANTIWVENDLLGEEETTDDEDDDE